MRTVSPPRCARPSRRRGSIRAEIRTRHLFVDDHGGWSYTTVYADVPRPVTTAANRESAALEWVPVDAGAMRSRCIRGSR